MVGLDRWAGIKLVRGYIAYIAWRIFKPTNNAAINSVVVSLYMEVIYEVGDQIGKHIDELVMWLWARTEQPIEHITIKFIGSVSGVEPRNLSKAGLLEWAGIIAAKQANASLGTDFKTFYPPAKARDELERMVAGAVMNGGGIDGIAVLPVAEALALLNEIAASYNQKHNINVEAMQQREIDRKKRAVIYQQTYRQTHEQVQVTLSPRNLFVRVGARKAMDDYYVLYQQELERRAAEKAAADAAAAGGAA